MRATKTTKSSLCVTNYKVEFSILICNLGVSQSKTIRNDPNQPSTVPPKGVQNCPGGGNISLKIIFLLVELCVFPELKSRKIPISLRACDLTPRLALAIKKVSIDEMEF